MGCYFCCRKVVPLRSSKIVSRVLHLLACFTWFHEGFTPSNFFVQDVWHFLKWFGFWTLILFNHFDLTARTSPNLHHKSTLLHYWIISIKFKKDIQNIFEKVGYFHFLNSDILHTTTYWHFVCKVRLDTERTLQQLYQEKKQVALESFETSGNETDRNTIVGSVKRVMKRQVLSQIHTTPHSPNSNPSLNRNESKNWN